MGSERPLMSPRSTPGASAAPHSHAIFSVLKFDALIWSRGEYLVEESPPVMFGQSALFCASPARPVSVIAMAIAKPPTHVWRVQLRDIPVFIGTSGIRTGLQRTKIALAVSGVSTVWNCHRTALGKTLIANINICGDFSGGVQAKAHLEH